ncbi:MerR family transcriptional regulator [Bacillus sp. FJAT-50079]|uniref:MerR family transcriptional regulator n=1 Tax=Bacillus sp. FJAT-50079 TaxID=2833577 RepID=UPI001BCA3326|nr:MerR family transcriptional regulator [Bacillus sp. FJAT-50079]MBS4208014.1 MerR family transcriptional regulator [Bacillus sp. FJAT-50079]
MISIQQLSKQANVTTRTLRYYDAIDLLKPTGATEGGHRLYEETDLFKLQQIQFLQRIGFTLKEIKPLLETNSIDPLLHLENQLRFIRAEREQLAIMENELIGLIHSYSLEGKLDWQLILNMIQHHQENHTKAKQLYKQWFGGNAKKVMENLPNMNRPDEDTKEWIDMISQLKRLSNQSPSSKEVQEIVGKMTLKINALYGDNEEMVNQIWEVRKSPEKSEQLGWYPLEEKLLRFLDEAFAIYEQREGRD